MEWEAILQGCIKDTFGVWLSKERRKVERTHFDQPLPGTSKRF